MFWPSPFLSISERTLLFHIIKEQGHKNKPKKNLWEFIYRGARKEN